MPGNPTVVFTNPRTVVIDDRAKPTPGRGEVLVKTRETMISTGTELTILTAEFPPQSVWSRYGRFPFYPGYNNVGVVVEVGEGVDARWRGRRVGSYGGHAAFVAVSVESVHDVPEGLSDPQAVFFTIAEIVMNGVRRGGIQLGEAVVVYGLGLLGQLAVQFCRRCGGRPVVGVDVAPSRLELLPQAPGVVVVNAAQQDVGARVRELTRGRMADVVFEVTGSPELIPKEFAVLRPQGRFVVLSSPRGSTSFDFHDLCNAPSYTIIGAHNGSHPPCETPQTPWTKKRNVELFFDLVADGRIEVDSLISHRRPFTEAPQLYQMLTEDRSEAMGVLLDWA